MMKIGLWFITNVKFYSNFCVGVNACLSVCELKGVLMRFKPTMPAEGSLT